MLGKPIERGTVPEEIGGFDVVLWDHENDAGYTIMCYPKAKFSCSGPFSPQRGGTFCLPLDDAPKEIFFRLLNGEVTLPELWYLFHEPSRHAFALGMIEKEEWNHEEWERWKALRS